MDPAVGPRREARSFPTACVATPHHLASSAGLAVLAAGGNAVDAAVAANLVLGVVTPYHCGFGGDLFALLWTPGHGLQAYNGSGRAPAAATVEAVAAASPDGMPAIGPLSVTVPGAVEGWFALLDRFGTRSFGDLAGPALRYARDGFVPSPWALDEGFGPARKRHGGEAGWAEVYGAVGVGQRLRQPGLAATIETLSNEGPEPYYRGRIADAIVTALRREGGLVSPEDLAGHRGQWVEPLSTTYRGVQVVELPPNTQGVTALEALNIAQGFDPIPGPGAAREHLLVEAAKLALADRDAHVADPRFMRIDPSELASPAWAAARRPLVDPDHASAPPPGRASPGGTAYLCAVDADGLLVSLIQSNWTGFGSGVTVPQWGINLHNRGALFSLDPAHPNAVGPGKSPLHTLVPAMALRDGKPWLAFGTMGGRGQAQTHLQLLVHLIDDGEDLQRAIDAPRWMVAPTDWTVFAEPRFGPAILEGLAARGHRVEETKPFDRLMGHAHAIAVTPGGYVAATDPRAEGAALGR